MILPKEDKYYGTKTEMEEQIIHLLGGRVAEKLTLDDVSTGASNDIMRATEIAREMVTKYGFSEKLGPINYSSSDEVFLGKDFSTRKNYSEEVANEIDEEIRSIVESAFAKAENILKKNKQRLKRVAEALLEVETLDGEQFELLYSGKMTPKELAEDIKKKEKSRKKRNQKESEETARIIAEQEALEKEALEREAREGENPDQGIKGEYPDTDIAGKELTEEYPEEETSIREDSPADPAETADREPPEEQEEPEDDLSVYDTDYLNDDDIEYDEGDKESKDKDKS